MQPMDSCPAPSLSAHPASPTFSAVVGREPVPALQHAARITARPVKPHVSSLGTLGAPLSSSPLRQSPPAHPRGYPSLQAAFEPPSPGFRSLPSAKIFVDLFSGTSAPLSAAIGALGLARLEPLDKLHGCCFDLLDDLCLLASSGIVGAAAAAPPCASFSRARLRPGGPLPVRTVRHPTGIPAPTPAKLRTVRVILSPQPSQTFPLPRGCTWWSHSAREPSLQLALVGPFRPRLAVGTRAFLRTYCSLSVRNATG